MDKRLKDIIVTTLKSEYGTAYDIYADYCKAKGITPEIFRCDYEGINALFDNPAEAVYAFANADIQPTDCGGIWEHIYRNDRNQLTYCDDISEKVNLSPVVDWIFTLEDYDRNEIFLLLDEVNIAYNICKAICKDKSTRFCDIFTEWLDDRNYYNLATFVEEDWDKLLSEFEDWYNLTDFSVENDMEKKINNNVKQAKKDIVAVILSNLNIEGEVTFKKGMSLRENSMHDYGLYITAIKVENNQLYYHSPNFIDKWYLAEDLSVESLVDFSKNILKFV